LRRRKDFQLVQQQGQRTSGQCLLLLSRRGEGEVSRLGIIASRRVGGAVTRNRIKRWIREGYRRLRTQVPAGIDVVVVARDSAARRGFQGVADELQRLFRTLER
jgi:ribonuclease P protein component